MAQIVRESPLFSPQTARLVHTTYLYMKIRPKNSFLVFLRGRYEDIHCKEKAQHDSFLSFFLTSQCHFTTFYQVCASGNACTICHLWHFSTFGSMLTGTKGIVCGIFWWNLHISGGPSYAQNIIPCNS